MYDATGYISVDPEFDNFPTPSIKELMSLSYGDEPSRYDYGVPLGFGDVEKDLPSASLALHYGITPVKKHKPRKRALKEALDNPYNEQNYRRRLIKARVFERDWLARFRAEDKFEIRRDNKFVYFNPNVPDNIFNNKTILCERVEGKMIYFHHYGQQYRVSSQYCTKIRSAH